jgi:hypothetical protein
VVGCNTATLILTLTPASTNTTTINAFGSYFWTNTGQTYTTSGIKTGTTTNCVTQLLNLTISTSEIPTGPLVFCKGATVATATGTSSLKFYAKISGGTPLVGTTALATKTLFVTETINSVESTPRVAISIIVNPLPATPLTVTSADAKFICKYIGTSNPVAFNATGGTVYNWTVPAGASILTGAGTSDITVSFAGVSATPGLIGSVTARAVDTNSCISLPKALVLTTKIPSKSASLVLSNSGILSGGSIKKVGPYMGTSTVFTLTAAQAVSAASYRWDLPAGATQLSGGTSNVITVDFAGITPGVGPLVINVYSVGGCGESATPRTLTLARALPKAPTKLELTDGATVVTKVGAYAGKSTSLTLTATPFTTQGATATSYSWILPSGVNVTGGSTASTVNGNGTTTWTSTGTVLSVNLAGIGAGVLTIPLNVFAVNGAGTSATARLLTLISTAPAKPGAITVAGYNGCNATFTAQVVNVPGVDYAWTVSSGSVTAGQGTNSVTIDPGTATTVTITVIGSNGTGLSTSRILGVKKSILPCKLAPTAVVEADLIVNAFPNPSSDEFTIESSRKGASVQVYDMAGRLIEKRQTSATSLQVGRNYAAGVYNVIVSQGTKVKTLKVIKK